MGYFSEADIDRRMAKNNDDGVKEINFFASMAGFADSVKTSKPTVPKPKNEAQKPKESEKGDLPVTEEKPVEAVPKTPAPSKKPPTGPSAKEASEDQKRKEHEEAEAKRKAEWEAKRQAKVDEEQEAWKKATALEKDALVAASTKRVGDATERLTRRNMKECVTERLQKLFSEDIELAKQAMHPRKNMVNCFRYINRKALEFIKQELKDNGIEPNNEVYGSDVPDELCYQWAREYFFDMDAPEDKDENEEEFIPKPYIGKPTSKSAKKTDKKVEKKPENTPEPKIESPKEPPKPTPIEKDEQLDLFSMLGGDFAA